MRRFFFFASRNKIFRLRRKMLRAKKSRVALRATSLAAAAAEKKATLTQVLRPRNNETVN